MGWGEAANFATTSLLMRPPHQHRERLLKKDAAPDNKELAPHVVVGISYPEGMVYPAGRRNMNPNRTFGIELEAHLPAGRTKGELADLIRRRAGVRARCETYNHNTRDFWKLTTDASLGYDRDAGVEVVSPVLRGGDGLGPVFN
jgi:Putative amidoligase enzyme